MLTVSTIDNWFDSFFSDFDRAIQHSPVRTTAFRKLVDKLVAKFMIPGFDTDDVKVHVNDGVVSVIADKSSKDDMHLVNSHMEYTTYVPRGLDPESLSAEVKNGVLVLSADVKQLHKGQKEIKVLKGK